MEKNVEVRIKKKEPKRKKSGRKKELERIISGHDQERGKNLSQIQDVVEKK